jgi:spermidine synthase
VGGYSAFFLRGAAYATRAVPEGCELLEAAESPYQSLRVVEFDGEGGRLRQLQVNEGFDSFQSVWQPEAGLLPPSYYYDYFCLPPWWSRATGEWRLMVLGLGAGTAWRVLEGELPTGCELDASGVEIDPSAIDLASRWMDLPPDDERHHALGGWDARTALRYVKGGFDEIVLDAYANQMEIPAHLCSVEFFEEVKERLRSGGWLAINIGGFGFDDPVVEAVSRTAVAAFESEALLVRVPFSRNIVAFLRRSGELPRPGEDSWSIEPGEVAALLAPLELEGRWKIVAPGGEALLTDDRNPIERLQRESIAAAARRLTYR